MRCSSIPRRLQLPLDHRLALGGEVCHGFAMVPPRLGQPVSDGGRSDERRSTSRFSGSVPANYDRYMVPLLFRPYARGAGASAPRGFGPRRILETAAGTGVVTAALAARCPTPRSSPPTSTSRCSTSPRSACRRRNVTFRQADALDLPFDDASFDLVVCQFGVDVLPRQGARQCRSAAGAARRRALSARDLGPDRAEPLCRHLAQRELSTAVSRTTRRCSWRGPFSYSRAGWIERDLRAAGFDDVEIETVELSSRAPRRRCRSGLCYGTPMGVEIERNMARTALDRVRRRVAAAAFASSKAPTASTRRCRRTS